MDSKNVIDKLMFELNGTEKENQELLKAVAEEIRSRFEAPETVGGGYFRTVYELEVLTDRPLSSFLDLEELHCITDMGDGSGSLRMTSQVEVDKEVISKLLTSQGSDPSFLTGTLDDEIE